MRKIILTVFGILVLTACSEDIYQEIDDQIEDGELPMSTNSFPDNNPGWINFLDPDYPFINIADDEYYSPWDIWFRNKDFTPIYQFSNRGGCGHTSPLKLEIIPWAGLAYFDGNDDGNYTDLDLAQQTGGSGIVANFNSGGYPTLFLNNQEVGNLVPADPITLDGTTMDESELIIVSDPALTSDEHLLANPAIKLGPYNNLNKYLLLVHYCHKNKIC